MLAAVSAGLRDMAQGAATLRGMAAQSAAAAEALAMQGAAQAAAQAATLAALARNAQEDDYVFSQASPAVGRAIHALGIQIFGSLVLPALAPAPGGTHEARVGVLI